METTTSIEVLAKTTADNLRIKNAEFLAKYPTDDSQIDYYTGLAEKVFDEFEIDGTYKTSGVRKNVETWFENKKAQMELFRKHPYWNEEAKAIVFVQDELRTIDYDRARIILGEMGTYIEDKLNDRHNDGLWAGLYYALYEMHENGSTEVSTITDEFITRFRRNVEYRTIPKDIERMLKVGTKITKFAHKCFTQWEKSSGDTVNVTKLVDEHSADDRTYNSFDKMYARFADALSELMIKKITLVSLHFCDFMLMSNGNSWSSCHYINSNNIFHEHGTSSYSGCYKQGCLSYALDEPSFLFYTLPNTYEGEEYYRQQKMNRMCCQYEQGILVTGKCYPDNNVKRITRYRQIMQLVLSTVESVPNLWTFSRKMDRISTFVTTVDGSGHYRDYENSGQKPTISFCKHLIDLDHVIRIGHEAYCVHCGTSLADYTREYLQCSKHRYTPICTECGRRLEEGEMIIIDDEVYCKDCCFWCEYHGRYEENDEGKHILRTNNGDITICDYALNYYFHCDNCDTWHRTSERHRHGDEIYCDDCYQILKEKNNWTARFDIIRCEPDEYKVGDYVVMVDDVSVCSYTATLSMRTEYPGIIARIEETSFGAFELYAGTGISCGWNWSANCFVGKLVGDIDESMLGKTLEEIM